jgi:hypothetical protein
VAREESRNSEAEDGQPVKTGRHDAARAGTT